MRTTRSEAVFSNEEFAREARRIDSLIWDATGIVEGENALFCGFANSEALIERALVHGAKITVIESNERAILDNRDRKVRVMRGSTSVIPARDNTFDVAVAHHYLHEVDPLFHSQIVSEMARIARRVVIVEPSPPTDALGQRIAMLYSRAKREFGAFENYQPLDYWRKLLSIVKAEVTQAIFAFSKVPPREYLFDTIELLLHTIAVQEAPEPYIEELRRLADRPDAQLLPPARYVLVGAAAGDLPARVRTIADPAANVEPAEPVATPFAVAPPVSDDAARLSAPAPQPWAPPPIDPSTHVINASPPPAPPKAFGQGPQPFVPPPASPPPPANDDGEATVFTPTIKPFGVPTPPAAAPQPAAGTPFGFPGTPPPAAPPSSQPAPFGMPFAIPQPDEIPIGMPPPAPGMAPGSNWKWEPPEEPAAEGEPPGPAV